MSVVEDGPSPDPDTGDINRFLPEDELASEDWLEGMGVDVLWYAVVEVESLCGTKGVSGDPADAYGSVLT